MHGRACASARATESVRSAVMKHAMTGLAAAAIVALAQVGFSADRQPGPDLYKLHCASCHGLNASGSGLMTPQLRHVPPDLTVLAKNNGGVFPRARVRRIVEGREVPAHGERDMPIWGDAFTRVEAGE